MSPQPVRLGVRRPHHQEASADELHGHPDRHHHPADPVLHLYRELPELPGLGVAAPMPSLGSLATDAVKGMNTYPMLLIAPALMISIMILVFNLFGDGLRDAFDPKLKS